MKRTLTPLALTAYAGSEVITSPVVKNYFA